MAVGMYGSGHYVHDLLALRRASRLHPRARLGLHVERDTVLVELARLDEEAARLTDHRLVLLDRLDRLREELWPRIPGSKGRRPPAQDCPSMPPAMSGSRALGGRPLRHAALEILRRDGALALPDLHAALHRAGYHLASDRPTQALADAMGYAVELGHARRVSRGVYAVGPGWQRRRRRGAPDPAPPLDPDLAWDPSGQERELHPTPGVVRVEVDNDDRLPGPEAQPAADHGQADRGTDDGREQVVGAVARGPMGMAIPVIAGEQALQGGDQVLVGAGSRLDHGQSRGGMGNEDIDEAVIPSRAERADVGRDIRDPTASSVDVQHQGVHSRVLPHGHDPPVKARRHPP